MTDAECAFQLGRAEGMLAVFVVLAEPPIASDLEWFRGLVKKTLDEWERERAMDMKRKD